MKKAILITQNELELPCVILPVERPLFPTGKEVLVYCQNRLVKGYMDCDEEFIAELEIVSDFCIIPELNEFLKDLKTEKHELPSFNWF